MRSFLALSWPGLVLVSGVVALLSIDLPTSAPSRTKERAGSFASLSVPSKQLTMGSVTLEPCDGLPAYCGSLDRPIDPAGEVPGTIAIRFELYPHRDTSLPALEPIVAAEGGPGYPTVGSRVSYIDLFWPLMDRRDLLLVDNRGTGASHPIDCPSIQKSPFLYPDGIEACGRQLGATSDLYGSAFAADDLAAILDSLDISRVNLYGDSYGTFFSQTFAGRHPERLRSLVLDSAYPVRGQSPWYPEAAPAWRRAYESVCAQSASCPSLPGGSLARLTALVEQLRAQPFEGDAQDGDGTMQHVVADAGHVAFLAFSNSTGPVVYRELDAAARAAADGVDTLPLLRLLAENRTASQSGGPPYRPRDYSAGLFTAVSCSDYPFVYDLTKPAEARIAQRDAAFDEARRNTPELYSPFSIDEYDSMPLDYSVLGTCLPWPVPSAAHPPGQPVPPGAVFTSAPVLVLSGSLDTITPEEQGEKVAALFPDARHVVVSNSFHVTALGEQDHCASEIVRRFVGDLDPGDISCASAISEVRMLPRFARLASQLPPALASQGNQGTDADLRAAAAAALTAGDAVGRWWVNLSSAGVGLRGGAVRFDYSRGLYEARLVAARFVEDVEVSGRMTWDYVTPGATKARLTLRGAGTAPGTLSISWEDREPHAMATISGTIGGRKIAATMIAP